MSLVSEVPLPRVWNRNRTDPRYRLSFYSREFQDVIDLIQVDAFAIYRIENKYLYGRYLLKKKLYGLNGHYVERTLFHATGSENYMSIIKDNFDYRRVRRGRFGRGVSFTPCPFYADREGCRQNHNGTRAMIVAKVLIGKSCHGFSTTQLPEAEYDTTTNNYSVNKSAVIVKYYDDEFYPEYVALYKY